jgi:transposase-like protein
MKRKKLPTEFKAKVAVEAIKGHLTANEIASEYEVHVTQVNSWKKTTAGQCERIIRSGYSKNSRQSMNTKAVSSMKK